LRADRAEHSSRAPHADCRCRLRVTDRLRESGEPDARADGRQREVAIRAALGADRRRIFQQLIVESLLMAIAGGALGALLAAFGVKAFVASRPVSVPRIDLIAVDLRILAFTSVVSILTGMAFGLAPAIRASSVDLLTSLKDSAAAAVGSGGRRTRSVLVVGEVALAIVR